MAIKNVSLGDFSDLSYIDLPESLIKDLKLGKEVKIAEFCGEMLNDKNYINGLSGKHGERIQSILKKYSGSEYSTVKIVGYENHNNSNGFVGYAIETKPKEVVIVSRGSEFGDDDKSWVDWIDNVKISRETDTMQQQAAKEFLEKWAGKYGSISLTGHSKGGNNVLYAAIKASEEIKKKIKSCETFNAPGFSNEFLNIYKTEINLIKEKIIEYRQRNDYVSPIMNNIGTAIFIAIADGKYDFTEHHSLYTMKFDSDGNPIPDMDQRPGFIPDFINNLVLHLLNTVPEDELDDVVDFVEKFMGSDEGLMKDNKFNFKNLLKVFSESDVELRTIKIIILSALSKIAYTAVDRLVNNPITEKLYGIPILRNTPTLIMRAISGLAKSSILQYVKKSINVIKYELDSIFKGYYDSIKAIGIVGVKNILKGSLNTAFKMTIMSPGKLVIDGISKMIKTKDYFIVDTNEISIALTAYKKEKVKIEGLIALFEDSLRELKLSGWKSQAGSVFYDIKFLLYKKELNNFKKQIDSAINMLTKALEKFEMIAREEKALLNAF